MDTDRQEGLSPSAFMRRLRPEYYSDTVDHTAYVLDAKTLEYCLETITARKETEAFELFCRRLCQRAICPNLRPQSGPDGGGDSKADTETFPVASDIAQYYAGSPLSGDERWAFAFSAKKTWAEKVKSDVKGIIETGRTYSRIICVTSRFAKSKTRDKLEQELTAAHGIPVTIHDRSWIVAQVIEEDRKDIAFNYLGVGEAKADPLRLGPMDYSRARQLAEIEKSLGDDDAYAGIERQRVIETLTAAKLIRNLERSRISVDGAFLRAIRIADAHGSLHQRLEARYEHAWTAYWWFDDFAFVNDGYDAFAAFAFTSLSSTDVTFVCNLWQLLINALIHSGITEDAVRLDERTASLRAALTQRAGDPARPNSALEAATSLTIVKLSLAYLRNDPAAISAIWPELSSLLDRAHGLGEYDLERLEKIIEIAGDIAGNDPAYTALIEQLADVVAKRTSEAEGAIVLLRRAQKLELDDHFDMIRLLGKAAPALSKREYNDHLIEALGLLTLAYRSAGLLWAARATSALLTATIIVESEDGTPRADIVPTLKVWAWHAVGLRHVPDCLYLLKFLRGAQLGLPFTDEAREKIGRDIRDLDMALAHLFLNADDLQAYRRLPDFLERLHLFSSRTALLYSLGHLETLRAEGSIPEGETEASVQALYSKLAHHKAFLRCTGPAITTPRSPQTRATSIVGMTVTIDIDGGDDSVILAEMMLVALEVFFATALELRVVPHTERLHITVASADAGTAPAIDIDELSASAIISWPVDLIPTSFERKIDIRHFLTEASGLVLGATCVIEDPDTLLASLFGSEAVHHRLEMAMAAPTGYHRAVGRFVLRLEEMIDASFETYEARPPRPTLLPAVDAAEPPAPSETTPARNHRDVVIRSVIDVHAWDLASWRGAAFAHPDTGAPPVLGFAFQDERAARAIFQRWRERFGEQDTADEIYLGIVRQLSEVVPHHYNVLVSSKLPRDLPPGCNVLAGTKWMAMQPNDSENLERFLAAYDRSRAYDVMPVILTGYGPPRFVPELSIRKRELTVKAACDVGATDIEWVTLQSDAAE